MVMTASTSERTSDSPIGSGAMREGGVRPKMSRYQIGRPFDDRELRAAFRPCLERQDAEHQERPVEKHEEQCRIDGQDGLDEA